MASRSVAKIFVRLTFLLGLAGCAGSGGYSYVPPPPPPPDRSLQIWLENQPMRDAIRDMNNDRQRRMDQLWH